MGNLWEKAKQHPYATAGVIFAVGLVVILLYNAFAGSAATASGPSSDAAALAAAQAEEAASGNALQQTQAELQAATNQVQAGVAENGTNDATGSTIASIDAQQSTNQAQIAADSADTIAGLNTTSAEVASTAAVATNAANTNASTTQAILNAIAGANPSSTAYMGNLSVNPTTGVTTFDASAYSPAPAATANGLPYFITDPTGTVYGLETINPDLATTGGQANPYASLAPNDIYGGGDFYYAPTNTGTPNTTPVGKATST